jgi:transposase InsO family protein
VRYAAIDFLRERYPLSLLLRVLAVSSSGYHEWHSRPVSARQIANERLVSEIRVLHAQSFGSYGSPRIHASIQRQDRRIGRERIRRLMQEHQIVGRHRRQCCRTTDSNHSLPIAPNLLQQNFACDTPNTVWLADISYLPTDEGFLYLAAMKDLCTKKIVGWSMSETIDAQLAVDALSMAVARQRPAPGLVVHSDRGSQYASASFCSQLREQGMRQSMSRRGNCYDNAPMESFFSSLKGEYLEHQHFATRGAARAAVFVYVETFYNRVRLHSSIGYRSPNEFEAMCMRAA